MAEYVYQNLEGMLPELEDLEKKGIFERNELRVIIKRRTEMEYKLQRRVVEKEDFLKYLQYELNVDALRRKRMQKLRMNPQQHTAAEAGLVKRMHHVFQKALKKFGNDLKLWMQYIDFCKKMGSKNAHSRALGRVMQLHSHNPSVWIMAAKWEFEDNGSIDNARTLMQKALRLNQESKTLWLEYFRLELLHVDKIKKRKDVLSLSTESDEIESGALSELFLANKTASIAYSNAIKAFPDDITFREEFLSIYRLFPDTDENQNEIYEGLMKDFPDSEEAFSIIAKRPVDQLKAKASKGMELSEEDWKTAESDCQQVFEQGIKKFQTGTFYESYLQTFLEMINQDGASAEDITRRLRLVLGILSSAEEVELVTEQMFLAWSELLLNLEDHEGVIEILSKAVAIVPSPLLCERYLTIMAQVSDDWESLNSQFENCIKNVDPKDSTSLWDLWMSTAIEKNSGDAINIFEKSLSSTKDVAEMGRSKYLQWTYDSKGIREYRKLYKRLKQVFPATEDLVQLAIDYENEQKVPNITRIRRLYETAVDNFGKESIDFWLNFIKFELRNTETAVDMIGRIYWRALRTLDSKRIGEFIDKYTLINTGISFQ